MTSQSLGTVRRVDGPDAGPPPAEAPSSSGLLPATPFGWAQVRYVLTVYAAVRVGLFVLGGMAVGLLPRNGELDQRVAARDPQFPGWQTAITAWDRWDVGWFLRIASEGYGLDDASAAFFPLYPLVVRAVSGLPFVDVFVAAHLATNAALVGALLLLYRLTAAERDERTARFTVLIACVFPTGFFLFAPYSESLFLLLAVGCFYAARRGHWWVAGLCGAGASATRSVGLLLVLPLVVEAVQQSLAEPSRRAALRRLPARAAALVLAPVGFLLYVVWWQRRTGDGLRPFDAQGGFGRERSWPWEALWDGVRIAGEVSGTYPGGFHVFEALMVLLAVPLALWVALRTRPLYGVYALSSLAMPLMLPFAGRPFMSVPRFLVVVFPLFWALSAFSTKFGARDAVVAVSSAGLGVCGLLFVGNYFLF